MSIIVPTKMEKCKGAMLATAIGDALGWPNEPRSKNKMKASKIVDHFVEWERSSSYPRWHNEKILPGEYSDDTQLTLAVARSIITGDWENFFAEKELPFWLEYERGGGGAVKKAAKSCKKGHLLWQTSYTRDYFNAGGNGAAMRILPHVIASAKTSDMQGLMGDVLKDTLITHGHPRAFLGATCYAYALDYLLRKETVLEYGELVNVLIESQNVWGAFPTTTVLGEWLNTAKTYQEYNYFTEWESTRSHMVKQLEFIDASLKKGLIIDDIKVLKELECFGTANGAGDVAILAAVYLASKYANNPSLGLKVPAFLSGADTDTIASITGGLLGMLSGMGWIPVEWRTVQDYECLIQITELLLADDKKAATKKEVAEAKLQKCQWHSTPIGKMSFIKSQNIPNGKNGIVIIEKWKTTLGQTLYTKSFQPNSKQFQIQDSMPIQQSIDILNGSKQFVLNLSDIIYLLENPQFKTNITIGKVLNIIRSLIENKLPCDEIAKKFKIEQSMVEVLKQYVLSAKQ